MEVTLATTDSLFVDLFLNRLEDLLGKEVYLNVAARIIEKSYGCGAKKMDLHTAIKEGPATFEMAFIDLLGEAGKIILLKICDDIGFENHGLYCSRAVDFSDWLESMTDKFSR